MNNKIIGILAALLLVSVLAQAAQVQITWNPNTETDLAGYKLYYGTSSGTYGSPVDVGNVASYTLALTPPAGTRYYFALTAYDTSGNESVTSAEASVFIPDATPPAQPKGLLAKLAAAVAALFKGIFGISS